VVVRLAIQTSFVKERQTATNRSKLSPTAPSPPPDKRECQNRANTAFALASVRHERRIVEEYEERLGSGADHRSRQERRYATLLHVAMVRAKY
jgi:hypothetical protein